MPDLKRNLPILDLIIEDCETDVKEFDGKPFTGKTLGELHGILEAKILTLAKILKEVIEEQPSQLERILETLKKDGK